MRFVFCRMLTCTVVEMQQHKAETPSSLQHNLWTRLSPIYATKCLLHCSPLRYQHLSSGIILSGTNAIIVSLYIIKHLLTTLFNVRYQRLTKYFWLVSYFLLQQWQQGFFPPSVLLWPTSHTHSLTRMSIVPAALKMVYHFDLPKGWGKQQQALLYNCKVNCVAL